MTPIIFYPQIANNLFASRVINLTKEFSNYAMDSFSKLVDKDKYHAWCLWVNDSKNKNSSSKCIPIIGIYFGIRTPLIEILEIIQFVEENLNKGKPEQDKLKYYQCVPHDVKMEVEAKPFRVGEHELKRIAFENYKPQLTNPENENPISELKYIRNRYELESL